MTICPSSYRVRTHGRHCSSRSFGTNGRTRTATRTAVSSAPPPREGRLLAGGVSASTITPEAVSTTSIAACAATQRALLWARASVPSWREGGSFPADISTAGVRSICTYFTLDSHPVLAIRAL
eukprot:scaffold101156_cov54-Phaeocystis_antarctica.AAC.1